MLGGAGTFETQCCWTATSTLSGLTFAGTLLIGNDVGVTLTNGTTSNGSIELMSTGTGGGNVSVLQVSGTSPATLGTASTVTFETVETDNWIRGATGTETLTNQGTITGPEGTIFSLNEFDNQGTINATCVPVCGTLSVQPGTGVVTNTGILEATGNGATLSLGNIGSSVGGTFTNTGGTITAGPGSVVFLSFPFITGGTLNGAGTFESECCWSTTSGLSGLTFAGTLLIPNNTGVTLLNGATSTGTIELMSTGNPSVLNVAGTSPITLGSTSIVTMNDNSNNYIECSSCTGTLTNQGIITGPAGQVGAGSLNMTNSGTIEATNSIAGLSLVIEPSASGSGFNNKGKLIVARGGTMQIEGGEGTFLNFAYSTGTLTGGTYQVTGTLQIGTSNPQTNNIVTNDANITLTGTSSQITNQSGTSALATFVTNGSKGSFTLAGNRSFTAGASFANAGTIKVSKGSTFTVGNSGSYTQSSGKTTVDGTLAFSSGAHFAGGTLMPSVTGSIAINAGSVFGNGGTLGSNVTSSGTITPADFATTTGVLTVSGNYTQNSAGALDINIAGTTAGQFNVLTVTGSSALGGTLNIGLLNGFVPTVGSTFKILSASSVSGTFATVNGTTINSSEHFTVTYNSNNVTLNVVSGP